MKQTTAGRYEFRTFGEAFTPIAESIRNHATTAPRANRSDDLYILSEHDDDHIVKIRGGFLDVKRRIGTVGDLEQWRPLYKHAFPLSKDTIAHKLFPLLRVETPELQAPSYSIADFTRLIEAHPQLQVIHVHKQRRQYELGEVLCEITDLHIGSRRLQSICCKAEDPAAVEAAVDALGLSGTANRSYLSFLKAMAVV